MKANALSIRRSSLDNAAKLGYATNAHLPLLEAKKLRPLREVADRALCLFTVVAVACGFDARRARSWLKKEQLTEQLSQQERAFLKRPSDIELMQARVEGIWAFAWAGSLATKLDFAEACPNTLVKLFPDVLQDESSNEFRKKFLLRTSEEVVEQCDLAYCLHWSISDALLHRVRPPGKLHPLYVIERRRALEWLLSSYAWDDVPMDT